MDEAGLLQGRHVVAYRRRRDAEVVAFDDAARADGLACGHVIAHDGLEVEAAGRGLVAAVKEAVREDTALKILRERRHGVHVRHQRECVALTLAFFLQEVVDLGVEGFEMMDDFFAFHGQFSLKIDKERILLTIFHAHSIPQYFRLVTHF